MKKFESTVTYELKDKNALIEIKVSLSYRIPKILGDEIVNQVEQKINKVLVPDEDEGCAQGSFTVFRSDFSNILYIKGFNFWVLIDNTTTYEKMMSVVECVRTFFAELAVQHQFLYEFVRLNAEKEVEND